MSIPIIVNLLDCTPASSNAIIMLYGSSPVADGAHNIFILLEGLFLTSSTSS